MNITFKQVKEDIYNYYINESTKQELLDKSKVNTKMSQTYSDMPRGKSDTADSVSSEVFRLLVLESRIKKLNDRTKYIDEAECVLLDFEKEVIDYIKNGYKMSRIAVLLNTSRRRVVYARDSAIKKIWHYANKNAQSCTRGYYKC
ncbi:MAG TPA: hypothetical protein DCW90_18815 [Lachnospiraceae bacterium]|nr:hypothetical protein [Lachnospiraceae bacterium]